MVRPFYSDDAVTLYHGDCREVLPRLETGIADALVTDPPYGIVNKFGIATKADGSRRTLQFAWDSAEAVAEAVAEALRVVKRPGAAVVFCGLDTVDLVQKALRGGAMTTKPLAWVKECPPPAGCGNWWPSGFELGVYAYHSGAWFGDTDPKRSNVFVSDSYRFGQPGKVDHPTQKPLPLVKRHVEAVVPPGGLCLDPFAGSGTTLRAAKDTGRRAIGIEIHEPYCEIAARRLEQGVLNFSEPA